MTSESANALRLGTSDQPEEMSQYRSVSAWAVLALLLGIISVLALAHVMMWVMPFLAIVTGAAAARRIAHNDSLTGRTLAHTAIVLGCLFGAWAISRYAFTAQRVEREAREFAAAWMELVAQGDLSRLHQQNLLATDRIRDATKLAEYYKNNADAKKSLDKFVAEEPLKTAVQIGNGLQWSISGPILQGIDRNTRYVSVPIRVHGKWNGQPWASESILALQRSPGKFRSDWRVVSWGKPAKP